MRDLPGVETDNYTGITSCTTTNSCDGGVFSNEDVEETEEYVYEEEYVDDLLNELVEKDVAVSHMHDLLLYYKSMVEELKIDIDQKVKTATDYWIDQTDDLEFIEVEEENDETIEV